MSVSCKLSWEDITYMLGGSLRVSNRARTEDVNFGTCWDCCPRFVGMQVRVRPDMEDGRQSGGTEWFGRRGEYVGRPGQ